MGLDHGSRAGVTTKNLWNPGCTPVAFPLQGWEVTGNEVSHTCVLNIPCRLGVKYDMKVWCATMQRTKCYVIRNFT